MKLTQKKKKIEKRDKESKPTTFHRESLTDNNRLAGDVSFSFLFVSFVHSLFLQALTGQTGKVFTI
jgi:hypothetical protein